MSQSTYAIDIKWPLILAELGISGGDVLRAARLPADLFQRQQASLSTEEYFRFWSGLEHVSSDPTLPLALVQAMQPESFSPVFFACLSSETLDHAMIRLRDYKPLVGPMVLTVDKKPEQTSVSIAGLAEGPPPPALLMTAEVLFFVHLARLGTRDRVVPLRVQTPASLVAQDPYEAWLGCPITTGPSAQVVFSQEDAERPFLTASPAMWDAFEPSLRKRLSDVTAADSMTDRLRGWVTETIASGRTSIAQAARDLGMSSRTLQRRLSSEGTSFQAELSATRRDLAQHYLTQTQISVAEIAFLLGYTEQTSFFRAFHQWTGTSPEAMRKARVS